MNRMQRSKKAHAIIEVNKFSSTLAEFVDTTRKNEVAKQKLANAGFKVKKI